MIRYNHWFRRPMSQNARHHFFLALTCLGHRFDWEHDKSSSTSTSEVSLYVGTLRQAAVSFTYAVTYVLTIHCNFKNSKSQFLDLLHNEPPSSPWKLILYQCPWTSTLCHQYIDYIKEWSRAKLVVQSVMNCTFSDWPWYRIWQTCN